MLDQWYRQYSKALTNFIRSKGFSQEDAEDLCARIFLEAVQRQPENVNAHGWLYAAAQFRMTDRWRKDRRHPPAEQLEETSAHVDAPDADDGMLRAAFAHALTDLSPRQRHVLLARFWNERSIDELADELQTTKGAIKALQHKAMVKLRKQRDWSVFL